MNGTWTTEKAARANAYRQLGRDGAGRPSRTRTAVAAGRLLSERVRPLRFVLVGGLCGTVQLGLLAAFLAAGWQAIPANALAFLLSAQLNFALSTLFIWHDRPVHAEPSRGLARRWLRFHGSIAGTAVLNQAVFLLARTVAPPLVASGLGIGVAAIVNFLLQDRLVFRRQESRTAAAESPVGEQTALAGGLVLTVVNPAAITVAVDERTTLRRSRPSANTPPAAEGWPLGASRAPLPRVDVVIPVYNEERVLASSIGRLHRFLGERLLYDWRIVIADNASTDGTLEVAEELRRFLPRVAVLHLDEKGRGRALKAAWLGSDADVLSYMDVDLSTDLNTYPVLIEAIAREGYDVATGRRLGQGARVEQRRLLREVTSRGYNLLIALVFRPCFTDAQCGFKAISRQAARRLLPLVENNEWFFDTELLLVADKQGCRIKQIPVHWVDDPDSRVNIVKTATEDLRGLWRLKRAGY